MLRARLYVLPVLPPDAGKVRLRELRTLRLGFAAMLRDWINVLGPAFLSSQCSFFFSHPRKQR